MKFLKLFIIFICLISFGNIFAQKKDKKTINKEEQNPQLSNQFTFYAGLYSSTKGIRVAVNGASENEIIDFSEKADFNENEITLFLNFNWRFARMWSLSSEYFGVKNGISRTIDEDFEWEDQIFQGGAGIELGLNLSMYRVMIGRTITKGQKHELGVGIGAHILDIEVFIEGFAYVNNENTGEGADVNFERNTASVVAPLPNLGAWYYFAPTKKWLFTSRVDWFGISVGNYSGSMWNLGLGANYQFHKHIGVGLNYRYFDFTSKVDQKNWDGKFSLTFQGPLLTINANF